MTWALLATLLAAPAEAEPRGVEKLQIDYPPEVVDRAYRRRVAMVVGVDAYDSDPEISDLQYAGRDAVEFAGALREEGAFKNVLPLQGLPITREQFWFSFENITQDLGTGDTFVLYFAGHGSRGKDLETLYLLFSDSEMDDLPGTAVAMNVLLRELEQLPARKRVLILDTCHNTLGEGRSQVDAEIRGLSTRGVESFVRAALDAEMRLFAAAPGGVAIEDAELGTGGGVYTHFLIEAMRGAGDSDHDEVISVREAHAYATARTIEHTRGGQVPMLETSEVAEEIIYLAGERDAIHGLELDYLERLPGGDAPGGDTRDPAGDEPIDTGSAGNTPAPKPERTWLVGGGGRWAWDGEGDLVTAWALQAAAWRSVADRWWLGVRADYGLGAAPAVGVQRAGQAELRVAWAPDRGWSAGPVAGVGTIWQQADGAQFGTSLSAGATLRWTGERAFASLEPTFTAALVDGERSIWALPGAALSAGLRL